MRVQLACHTNSFGRFGPKGTIEHVKEVGLDSIELLIHTEGLKTNYGEQALLTENSTVAEIKEVEALLKKNGVKLAAVSLGAGNPLVDKDREILEKKLEIAARLGVELVSGPAGVAANEDDRAQLLKILRQFGNFCSKKKMIYCCDTLPGLCVNHRTMQKTMEDIRNSNVKLCFDTGNLSFYNPEPIVEVALAKVCQHVRLIRLKDSMGEQSQWYFPALGYGGSVDFLRVLQLMRDCGYKGPYVLSIDGLKRDEQLPLVEHQNRLKESLESLQDCGYFDQ